MATANNMMGVGYSAEQATLLGSGAVAAVTGAGTTAAAATVLKKAQNNVAVTAAGGADSIKLPADADLMVPYIIYNPSGTTANIFPPTSGTINGGTATTGSVALTTLKAIVLYRYSSTGWFWVGTL